LTSILIFALFSSQQCVCEGSVLRCFETVEIALAKSSQVHPTSESKLRQGLQWHAPSSL